MPSAEVLESWTSISDARDHFKISLADWAKLAASPGDETLDEMGMLAGVDDND